MRLSRTLLLLLITVPLYGSNNCVQTACHNACAHEHCATITGAGCGIACAAAGFYTYFGTSVSRLGLLCIGTGATMTGAAIKEHFFPTVRRHREIRQLRTDFGAGEAAPSVSAPSAPSTGLLYAAPTTQQDPENASSHP